MNENEDHPTADEVAEDILAEGDAPDAADDAAIDGADSRIEQLEAELAKAKQDVLYAHAEAQNVRRRGEKELADAHSYAATKFARDILSVSDNLARGLDAIPDDMKGHETLKPVVAGIEATARELAVVFEKHGIQKVATVGEPLDPHLHQAMVEIPSDETDPGTIVQEMQSGYTINGRLLRPAMVGVAKKPG